MFRKSPPQEEAAPRVERKERNEQSFLQHGVRIDGDIHADGDLRIDGQVKGTLSVGGTLTAGPKSSLVASIKSRSVVIHGSLDGVVQAAERIHLSRGARVQADLYCQSLVIDEGVFFHGRSHMGETATAAPEAQQAAGRSEALSAVRRDPLSTTRREAPVPAPAPAPARADGPGSGRSELFTGQKVDHQGVGRVDPPSPPRQEPQPVRSPSPSGSSTEQGRMVPDPLRRGPSGPAVTSQRTPDGPSKPSSLSLQEPASGSGVGVAPKPLTGTEPKPAPTGPRPASNPEQAK